MYSGKPADEAILTARQDYQKAYDYYLSYWNSLLEQYRGMAVISIDGHLFFKIYHPGFSSPV